MIGKAEWFERRKYGGWGLFPKVWQGWAYMAIMVAIVFAIQLVPFFDSNLRMIATILWVGVFAIDTIDMMAKVKKDEREHKIESIAERNAAWAIVFVLAAGISYQAALTIMTNAMQIDLFLVAALIIGLIVKATTNLVLERREL
jgi:TctA family transporter